VDQHETNLRDLFAMVAMLGQANNQSLFSNQERWELLAQTSYKLADQMIKERKNGKQ
jgi:hypothetical protein